MNIRDVMFAKSECHLTDSEILGDIVRDADKSEDYITSNNYYVWYYSIAKFLKPRRIGEIGVRLGYSSKAMLRGTIDAGTNITDIELFGFDNESYVSDSMASCREYFRRMCLDGFWVRNVDTNMIGSLGVRGLDLIHVDGDHREEGAYHDLGLALDAIRPDGVILVDDVWPGSPVKVAADRFCSEMDLEPIPIPHLRHLYLINVP